MPLCPQLLNETFLSECYIRIVNNTSVTRGNKFKLQNQSFNHNFRKIIIFCKNSRLILSVQSNQFVHSKMQFVQSKMRD